MYLTLGNAPSRTWGPSVRCATLARERHSRSWIWELIQAPPVVPAGRSDPSRSGCLATADRNVGPSSPIRHPHVRHPGRSTAALEIDPGPSARTVRRTPSIARRIRRLQYFLRWLPRAASRGLAAPAQPIRILPVRCLGWCADSTGEIPDSRPPPPRRKASGNARGGDARERGACFPSPHQRRDMGRGGRRAASPHPSSRTIDSGAGDRSGTQRKIRPKDAGSVAPGIRGLRHVFRWVPDRHAARRRGVRDDGSCGMTVEAFGFRDRKRRGRARFPSPHERSDMGRGGRGEPQAGRRGKGPRAVARGPRDAHLDGADGPSRPISRSRSRRR